MTRSRTPRRSAMLGLTLGLLSVGVSCTTTEPSTRSSDRIASTLTLDEFRQMQETAIFGPDDVAALRRSRAILEPRLEGLLDTWYGFVGSKPQLLASFSTPDGEVLPEYLAAVRKRFGTWVLATADADYDEDWLRYQLEIGRRHHRSGKNDTDSARSTENIPFRYLIPLCVPILTTLEPVLAEGARDEQDLAEMHAAWTKSVLLQVTLWSTPYVFEGDY